MTKSVHFIGIGGSGLSAIARLLLESGYQVSGSDRELSPFAVELRKLGALIFEGHAAENIRAVEMVVRSSAIADNNPEVVAAKAAGIPVYKRSDFLGHLMENRMGVAIAGTHGKTTTTAMMAWTLTKMGVDPSFIVGGLVNNLGVNAHAGKGQPFVIEADEYDRMFLGLKPIVEIVTNVEHDHPDCYPTAKDFFDAFNEFTYLLPPNGLLIACGDDFGALQVGRQTSKQGKRVVFYGVDNASGGVSEEWVLAQNLKPNNKGGYNFTATVFGASIEVAIQVPGIHNVRNALGVLTAISFMGYSLEEAAHALAEFTGAGRRFEIRGVVNNIEVVDDYGHHPTEILTTLAGARARYGQRRIWAVWQPHTYSRTLMLFKEFASAFVDANQVLVTEVYKSREPEQAFSSRAVVEEMVHPSARFIATLDDASVLLCKELRPGDVLIVFSAGDADKISTNVLDFLRKVNHA